MAGGVGDDAVYQSLVPLGVCPLVMTGTDSALRYRAANAATANAHSSHEKTKGE
jgi:hypothetical protein